MLLVFEMVFSVLIISQIESIGGGWVEDGAGMGGGEPKAGESTHLDSKSSTVPSVGDIN